MPQNSPLQDRILILAPRGRDAQVVAQVISAAVGKDGAECEAVATFDELSKQVMAGAGVAVVADEALLGADLAPLASWLAAQEP